MIPSTPRRAGPLNGNGTATSFPFSFKVYATGDVAVVRANTTTATETLLTEGVDYSVTLNADQVNNPGGTITYPISGSPLASGFSLTVYGDTDYTQTLSLVGVSKFDPSAIEKALDRVVMQTQQLLEQLSRTLTLAVSTGAATNLTLPAPLANNLLGWNASGGGLQNVDASTLATLVAYGTAMRDYFTGDGVTKDFTLSANPGALGNIDVDISGVTQNGQTDFTWAGGTTLSFTTAPPNLSNIQVRYLQALPVGTVGASTVGTTQLIDGGVTTVKLAAGSVTNAKVSDVAFSKLTGVPSTLAGLGIAPTDASLPRQLQAVSSSVAGNALTLGYSGGVLDFRNSSQTNGAVSTLTVGALSLIVPSGATLGMTNAQPARLALLVANSAGTPVLCVVNLTGGLQLDETNLISPTAISAASNSATTIYSASAVVANSPYRIVGFVDITEATAGAWASDATLKQGCGGQALAAMSSIGYGQTWQTTPTLTRAASTTYYNNTGKPIQVVVTAIMSGGGASISMIVNGVTLASQTSGGAAWGATMSVIVPPGGSYMFQSNVGFSTWAELR